MFVVSTALAQLNNSEPTRKDHSSISKTINNTNTSSLSSAATVIWSDDCSDINTWSLSNTSIPPLDWSIESDPAAIETIDEKNEN